jgi:predicted nucleic acid-binding protein
MKLYLDANIYYNLWKDEVVKGIIPAGLYAEQLFERLERDSGLVLVVSDFLADIISYNNRSFGELFKKLMSKLKALNILEFVRLEYGMRQRASRLVLRYRRRYPTLDFEDIVHLLLAKKSGAILVTRDEELIAVAHEEKVQAGYPENVVKL